MATPTNGTAVPNEQMEIRDYVRVVWLRRWWVVVPMVVFALFAFWRSASQPHRYVSSSSVLVLPVNVPEAGITSQSFIFMPNEVEIASSEVVAQRAAEKVAIKGVDLAGVSVTNPVDTQTIVFVSRASNPRSAMESAQAYADSYLEFRRDNVLSSIDTQLESIKSLIDRLETTVAERQHDLENTSSSSQSQAIQFEITSLLSQIQDQQQRRNDLELASNTPVGQVLQPAGLPSAPASSHPERALILGAVIGLLLGIGLAFLRDRLDQRIRSREDVETAAGAPLLGQVPTAPSLHRHLALGESGDLAAAEAFRVLRTRLLFAGSKSEFRTVMVTSARFGEGKTTTSANISLALAQADFEVVLVSADLRRPGMQRYFPDTGGMGLADVLNGTVSISDVVVPTQRPHLNLVPAGSTPLSPGVGLGSNVMLSALSRLSEQASVVVVDAPPILGVSDTLDLASLVDAVLLVVDSTSTRKDVMLEAVHELRSVGASLIGVVLTRWDADRFSPYYSSSGYGSGPAGVPIEDEGLPGRPQDGTRSDSSLDDARSGAGSSDGASR
jgi:succinoglycan biosynthesis transport protein ExoP